MTFLGPFQIFILIMRMIDDNNVGKRWSGADFDDVVANMPHV